MRPGGLFLFLFTQLISESSLTATCEYNIELDSMGYVTSPNFPLQYPPSQRCVWVITAPEPRQRILLNFSTYFHLEDKDCKHDYVEVYDGGDELSPLLGRFCGATAPPPIISYGNQVVIKFVSDNETERLGFTVRYDVFQPGKDCSRNFTAPEGVITTPNYPNKYPNNLNCTLMIIGPQMSEIMLEFNSFSMEPDSSNIDTIKPISTLCQNDRLEIWDGLPGVGTHIGKYCGLTSPGQVISKSGILSMTITTGDHVTKEGFSAKYTIHEKRLSSRQKPEYTCGGNLDLESAGYLSSPGFPLEYPPSQLCAWVITAPEAGQKIFLNFNPHFYLEDKDCNHDYVEVYNGGDELSPLLGRFCGSVAPSPIMSSGNQVLIKFVSDNETHDSGFSIQYEVFQPGPDCSRNFTAPQGIITTPNFPKKYPNNLNCTLVIMAPQGSEITLEFHSFSMEPDSFMIDPNTWLPMSTICQYDRLDIWDGLPGVGTHIGKYCGLTSPGQVISRSGTLSMTITTDKRITKEGFSANYTIRESSLSSRQKPKYTCGGNLDLESAGYLSSPGFPLEYPPSQLCAWVITAPEAGQKIFLNFNPHFYLEDKDCNHDYVEVYNGGDELSPLLGRFCGSVAPSPIISSGNQVLIKFVSDNETHDSGFSIQYEVFQPGPVCSRNFTAPRGVITTPNFPKKYPNNLNCTLMIIAPQGSEIVLEFDSFIMEPDPLLEASTPCQYDWLEIWDGLPGVGTHIGKYCGYNSPNQVISHSGIMSMTITTDTSRTSEGFSANYTIRESSPHSGGDRLV